MSDKSGFNGTIAYGIASILLAVGIFFSGMHVERKRSTPKATTVMCNSSEVLQGRGWIVDLKKPLFEQNCIEHDSFPGKILCERSVTIECDKP